MHLSGHFLDDNFEFLNRHKKCKKILERRIFGLLYQQDFIFFFERKTPQISEQNQKRCGIGLVSKRGWKLHSVNAMTEYTSRDLPSIVLKMYVSG